MREPKADDSIDPLTTPARECVYTVAQTRPRRDTGVIPLDQDDPFGRRTMPASRPDFSERRTKRWARARNAFFHRVKNGIHDPLTFFQLVEELANVRPYQSFKAADLAAHLNERKNMFTWDPVVVGRILNDLVESWNEANPGERHQPLVAIRQWSGREYQTTDFPEARAVLAALLDDLVALGEQAKAQEATGRGPGRLTSPLTFCPSVMRLVA